MIIDFDKLYITGINEIMNVWANDADKISVFIGAFFIPYLIYLIIKFDKIFNLKKRFYNEKLQSKNVIFLQIIFLLIFISFLTGMTGVGQIILPALYDSIARSTGILILLSGIFLIQNYKRLISKVSSKEEFDYKVYSFNKEIRYPELFFLLMISFGSSLLFISLSGIILTTLILFPSLILRIKSEEKQIMKIDNSYHDYKLDVPMLFPNIFAFIKKLLLNRYGIN